MLAAIPETAKKLSEKVIKSNEPVVFRLQDVKKLGITTNDFSTLRRSIVFAGAKPIVPEMAKGRGRSMAYRSLSEDEFKKYEFNERNFSVLAAKDISNVRRRVQQVDKEHKYTKRQMLQLLTICDVIIQWGGRSAYVDVPPKFIACSVLKNEEESEEMINFLISAGILNKAGSKLCYNDVFRDVESPEDKNSPKVASGKEHSEEIKKKLQGLDDIEEMLDGCKEIIASRRDAIESQGTTEDEYLQRIKYLEAKLAKKEQKDDSLRVVMSSFTKMKDAYDKLKERNTKLEAEVSKYRSASKNRLSKTQSVMDNFVRKATDISAKYRESGNETTFVVGMNALIADTHKSVENIIKR